MAVPKKRTSQMKTRSRRSANMKIKLPGYQYCTECDAPKRRHRACTSCGTYRGEEMMEIFEY